MSALTFRDVDGIVSLASEGRLTSMPASITFSPTSLGPACELMHHYLSGRLPHPVQSGWILNGDTDYFPIAPRSNRYWISASRDSGSIDASLNSMDSISFLMGAKHAAREVSKFSLEISGQFAAAIGELKGNIMEHSMAAETGQLFFKATPGVFEFVVADRGIGVLRSFNSSETFAHIHDHGIALQSALQEGCSRFGLNVGRGLGFRPIFVGLANLRGSLRFRSGDHALTMDGTDPTSTTTRLVQKPHLEGFFISVRIEK